MLSFDAAHKAVHYPPDRRFRIWIKPSFTVGAVILILLPLVLAWRQAAIFSSLDDVLKAESLVAYEMNGAPPGEEYGVPLRLRAENQLGCKMYKMVKWIERIEFIESEKAIGKGER